MITYGCRFGGIHIFISVNTFLKKYVIMFVTKSDFLRLTYERKGGDDKYGLRKAI